MIEYELLPVDVHSNLYIHMISTKRFSTHQAINSDLNHSRLRGV